MLASFEQQAKERCKACGGKVIELDGEADHVHILFELPPTAALFYFMNAIKTGTSRRLRNEFKQHLAGVFVSLYSGAALLRPELLRRAARNHPAIHPATSKTRQLKGRLRRPRYPPPTNPVGFA